MSPATAARISLPAKRQNWLKYGAFAVFAAMVLYVLQHNESFLIHPQDPVWQHYQPFKWWLLPHGLAGACAILLGPFQFSDRLRKRFTRLHRVMGRFYVFGALVAAPLGAYIQYFEERMGGPRSFSVAAGVDAVLWWVTTAIALSFILKGNVQRHRQWMTRSFFCAIIFLEVRVIGGVTGLDQNPAAIETIVWTCVAFALLAGDIAVYWQDIFAPRPKARAAVSN